MSKYKKKIQKDTSSYETDIRLERSIEYMGWFYLLAVVGLLSVWLIFDAILDVSFIDLQPNVYTFTFIAFTGTASAFSFALGWNIKNNREKKKQLVYDWLIAQFMLCIFAIFVLAIYQW
ncbi:MAG: hypothetical protein KGD63_10415 [Candidatus Lokiarchaeota archaeon]|nr:hypothetical protein [Candidatus Lokiarchaeota archaeon]